MFGWFYRCTPGLSLALIVVGIISAFSTPAPLLKECSYQPAGIRSVLLPKECFAGLTLSQTILVVYTLICHIVLATFGVRLSWALYHVTKRIKAVRRARLLGFDPTKQNQRLDLENSGLDDFHQSPEVIHAIIIPNYMEDVATLKTTLDVFASHPRASTQYEIYLAMEAKEPGVREKAAKLQDEMGTSFRNIHSTFHPAGIPGEIAGKGSNVAFAAQTIFKHYRTGPESENVIITVVDADTLLQEDFFSEIRRHHVGDPSEAELSFYVCPFIFDRNAHSSPIWVRCSDLLWCWAGMSSLHPGAGISIPTSVYSLPLTLAERVGGWDSDPSSIGEDMHMLLKCYFGTSGQLITKTVFSPASQCNVSTSLTDATPWHAYFDTMCARYDQALRHMWGSLDTGYALKSTVQKRPRVNVNFFALSSLMWQAHFLSGHLLLLIVFTSMYGSFVPAGNIHPAMTWTFWVAARLRDISFVTMNIAFTMYYHYHETCVAARKDDMGHIPGVGDFSRRSWHWSFVLDRAAFPLAGIMFGSIPMMQAVLSHFFTDRLVYRVSKKPTFS